jgi:predicted HicB family RNase H-like nuclease
MKKNKDLTYYLSLPYKIEIYFAAEDSTWIAVHPELGRATCYSVGETQEKALKLLGEVKKDILEIALTEDKEIPEPESENNELPSGQFIIRIPRTLHAQLKSRAENEGISLNQFVLTILSEYNGSKKNEVAYESILTSLIKSLPEAPDILNNPTNETTSRLKRLSSVNAGSKISKLKNKIKAKTDPGF